MLDEFSPKEDALARAFKAMHSAYVEATSSPFYTYGQPLTSRAFEEEVAGAVAGYALAAQGQ